MSIGSAMNTAIQGLNVAQRAVDISSQNIANANTEGYSRQRVQLGSIAATNAPSVYTSGNNTPVGGVQITGITRIHDAFLEQARVNAGATSQALNAQANALSGAEGLLNEPGDDGVQTALDTFYSSWHDLAANPEATASGTVVIQSAEAVVNQLKFVSTGTSDQWDNQHLQLQSAVNDVNTATKSLALVNQRILEGKVAERPVNELLDTRDTLVRQIGELTGARSVESGDGTVSVLINGNAIVSGSYAETITLQGATSIGGATADPPRVTLGANTIPISNGKMAGLLAATGTDLVNFNDQLDGIANALRDSVNAQHAQGYTLDGTAGGDFFTGNGASGLQVAVTTSAELAVAGAPNTVDGSNALKIADLAISANSAAVLGANGPGPSVRLRSLVGDVGTKLEGLNHAVAVQTTVLNASEQAVESDSGVSVDEELTNLLQYQRAYQANARVISTVDEMLDTLVNRTAV
jgi:flagellar hook-associated protein 1 FlgK